MKTRYINQKLKSITMTNCVQHSRIVTPNLDFGFGDHQVQKMRHLK